MGLTVLLVDDDPLFRSRMQRAAQARGYRLEAFSRLRDVDAGKATRDFDVVVLNYFLDELRHGDGGDARRALESLPVVLVSNTTAAVGDESHWKGRLRRFARKADGCDAVLDAARALHGESGGEPKGHGLFGKLKAALRR